MIYICLTLLGVFIILDHLFHTGTEMGIPHEEPVYEMENYSHEINPVEILKFIYTCASIYIYILNSNSWNVAS